MSAEEEEEEMQDGFFSILHGDEELDLAEDPCSQGEYTSFEPLLEDAPRPVPMALVNDGTGMSEDESMDSEEEEEEEEGAAESAIEPLVLAALPGKSATAILIDICQFNNMERLEADRRETFERSATWTPGSVWKMSLESYYEQFEEQYEKIGADDAIKRLFAASFANILVPSQTDEGSEEDEEEEDRPALFNTGDCCDNFFVFCSALLTSWLLHVRKYFSADSTWTMDQCSWKDLSNVIGMELGDTFPCIGADASATADTPLDWVNQVMEDMFRGPAYAALKEHYAEAISWNLVDTIWNAPSAAFTTAFKADKFSNQGGLGVCTSALSGAFERDCPEGDVLHVHTSHDKPFQLKLDFLDSSETVDTSAFTIPLDKYDASERRSVVALVGSVYHVGHISEACVGRMHTEFLSRFCRDGAPKKKLRLIRKLKACIGHFWGFEGAPTPKGFQFLFDLYADCLRASWHIDHLLSIHMPDIDGDAHTWTYRPFRVVRPIGFEVHAPERETKALPDSLFSESEEEEEVRMIDLVDNDEPPPAPRGKRRCLERGNGSAVEEAQNNGPSSPEEDLFQALDAKTKKLIAAGCARNPHVESGVRAILLQLDILMHCIHK